MWCWWWSELGPRGAGASGRGGHADVAKAAAVRSHASGPCCASSELHAAAQHCCSSAAAAAVPGTYRRPADRWTGELTTVCRPYCTCGGGASWHCACFRSCTPTWELAKVKLKGYRLGKAEPTFAGVSCWHSSVRCDDDDVSNVSCCVSSRWQMSAARRTLSP